jgi:hypothetical protein
MGHVARASLVTSDPEDIELAKIFQLSLLLSVAGDAFFHPNLKIGRKVRH